jgi:hypothetical protein
MAMDSRVEIRQDASMGPQPWELRKHHAAGCQVAHHCDASMGPQPWELRKPSLARFARRSTSGFNGAAALGAAETCGMTQGMISKIELQWGRSLGSCGNSTSGIHGNHWAQQLQWGRSLGSCGNARRYPMVSNASGLQWGRSLGSCGNKRVWWKPARRIVSLQWGRSLGSCGNLDAFRHERQRNIYFNGAAALGAAETALASHLVETSGCTACRESPHCRALRTFLTLKFRAVEWCSSSWKYVRIRDARGARESCTSEQLAELSARC